MNKEVSLAQNLWQSTRVTERELSPRQWQALLEPSSIVVVGASNDPDKLSSRTLRYLATYGYQGKVFAVNPRPIQSDTVTWVTSISDLPDGIELAVVLLPSHLLPDALEECAARGIPCVVSVAGNPGGEQEAILKRQLREICARTGVRLIGHNGVGLTVPQGAITATISAEVGMALPRPGSIALITQSGALGNSLLKSFNAQDLGLRAWISTGNEIDLDVIQLARAFLRDPATRTVALFVEGLIGGDRLMPLAREAAQLGKAIVVRRAGRSESGRAASASHTGKMAGSASVWQGIARQGGLIEARSLDEMMDLLVLLDTAGAPAADEPAAIGILTVSGGVGVLAADEAQDVHVTVASLADDTKAGLAGIMPAQVHIGNPLDTSYISETTYAEAARLLTSDPAIGTVVVVYMSLLHDIDKLAPVLSSVAERLSESRHIVLCSINGADALPAEICKSLRASGIVVVSSIERAVTAVGQRARLAGRLTAAPEPAGTRSPGGPGIMGGIPEPAYRLCTTFGEAQRFADEIGYPIALKVSSPDIPHKTEVGGVALGIASGSELEAAWSEMVTSVAEKAPGAAIEGYSVQQMITDGVELIVGCSYDPEFGPIMALGWGGIYAEALEDVTFISLPASREEIGAAIDSLKVAKLLAGARGAPAADRDAAIEAALALGAAFIADPDVAEIDINPLLVRPRGKGVVALDFLAVPAFK